MNLGTTFQRIVKKTAFAMKKYAPQILTGLSAAGVVTTTVLAVKGTVKAVRKVDEEKEKQGVDEFEPKEVVKMTYKYYIPTAVSMGATMTFGILSCVSSSRRIAALTTAYQIAETAREEYIEATKEVVGKNKAAEIDAKAAEKRMERDEDNIVEYAERTRFGNTLFKDSITGRYFRSSHEAVKRQFAEFNNELAVSDYLELNGLYYKLEIDHDTEVGEYLGWNAGRGLVDYYFVDSHHPVTQEPCVVIRYANMPYYTFTNLRY